MRRRRVDRFVASLLARRRPRGFGAPGDDVDIIRTAVILQGASPDLAAPSEEFVSSLFDELSSSRPVTGPIATAPVLRRGRLAAIGAAAALLLVAGSATATAVLDQPASVRAAVSRPTADVRTVTLVDARHRTVGEINLYRGQPSWVFMDLQGTSYDGSVTCELRAADGSIVMRGSFTLTNGGGEWARTLDVGTNRITGAQIVTPSGATLASATFA